MTTTDTIRPVARPRGELTQVQKAQIEAWAIEMRDAEIAYKAIVVRALINGASFTEVAKFTGHSKDTLQRWKREAGK